MLHCIWLHYVFFAVHAELDQLIKGIRETLQMELPICTYPEEVYLLLVPSSHILKLRNSFFGVKWCTLIQDQINVQLKKH